MLLIIAGYIYVFASAIIHPFHVSVCEVYHNDKVQSLEISMKIFIDDFELSIQKSGISEFELVDVSQDKVDKTTIESYLKNHFEIKVNDEETKLEFLGFEFDENAILCYLEGKKIKKINSIEINNSIITEVYDDQINLTHFQYKDEMKSVKATKDNTTNKIDTSNW